VIEPKRIVITGASGVGKTSLANVLAEKLQLSLIPEVARRLCHQMGYRNPTEIPDQQSFRQAVLDEQIIEERAQSQFVSDRSTIDCWVLWQRWQICSAMTYDSEAYYNTCRDHAKTYTHVIYVPPMFTPPDDEFRWTEPDYVKQIDRIIRLTLYDWSLLDRKFTISCDGPEARAAAVAAWLNH
ncbi:MAG: ATP/GTP-binding protein, partial [Candidatus Saccharimonadales bacterium]